MENTRIRRIAIVTAAALATVCLGLAAPASAVVTKGEAVADKATTAVAGEVVVQHGVVTAPVLTDGEDGDVLTVFKVTDDARTLPWLATGKTIVLKGGVPVPATAIAQGDRVTVSGTMTKGGIASALKVVVQDAS
jgi:hypothetical protein